MRSSRKRRLSSDMKAINVHVTTDARDMLDRIAGPDSLGATLEELIVREYRRRERQQQSLQVANYSSPDISTM